MEDTRIQRLPIPEGALMKVCLSYSELQQIEEIVVLFHTLRTLSVQSKFIMRIILH